MAERDAERRDVGLHRVAAVLLDEALHLGEERLQRAAAVARQLAADEVHRLHAVGALVDHGNARIAHELLHALLGDVAVAAIDLLRQHRIGEALVGQHAFDHRREQAHVVGGRLPRLLVGRAVLDVALQRGPDHQRAARLR